MTRYFILTLLAFTGITAEAQKILSEGAIVYDVSVQTGSSQAKMADIFDGATTTVYIKEASHGQISKAPLAIPQPSMTPERAAV